MRVLGVDVGIRACGYVVAEVENLNVTLIKEAQIKPNPKNPLPEKLNFIFKELQKEVLEYKLRALVAEKLYSHYKHPTTLGILAQVRGVVVLLAEQNQLKFFEYSPTRARKSFLGKGSANSLQVKKMAENITGRSFKSTHTADAFSLVVAFSHAQKLNHLIMAVN